MFIKIKGDRFVQVTGSAPIYAWIGWINDPECTETGMIHLAGKTYNLLTLDVHVDEEGQHMPVLAWVNRETGEKVEDPYFAEILAHAYEDVDEQADRFHRADMMMGDPNP